MHPSKVVQKDILNAHKFNKNEICHRCFDNNLKKIFRTNILENASGQILLVAILMVT